jgi:Short repeat of unknown function (DUF308)
MAVVPGHGYRVDAGCADRAPLRLHVGIRDLDPVRHRRDRGRRSRDRDDAPRRRLVEGAARFLALVFIVAGIVAFIHPGDTFAALAGVFSFILIFAGTFDIIESISVRHEIEVWWLQLIAGIIELALGFWAAGYYGRSAVLLVAWVAAFAVIRGFTNILLAFRVRELQRAAPPEERAAPA